MRAAGIVQERQHLPVVGALMCLCQMPARKIAGEVGPCSIPGHGNSPTADCVCAGDELTKS